MGRVITMNLITDLGDKTKRIKKWNVYRHAVQRKDKRRNAIPKDKSWNKDWDGTKLTLEAVKKLDVIEITLFSSMEVIYVGFVVDGFYHSYIFFQNSIGFKYFEDMLNDIQKNNGYEWKCEDK